MTAPLMLNDDGWARELEALNNAFAQREHAYRDELADLRSALAQASAAGSQDVTLQERIDALQCAMLECGQREESLNTALEQNRQRLAAVALANEAAERRIQAQEEAASALGTSIGALRQTLADERTAFSDCQRKATEGLLWLTKQFDAERALLQDVHDRVLKQLQARAELIRQEEARASKATEERQTRLLDDAREAAKRNEEELLNELRELRVNLDQSEHRQRALQGELESQRVVHLEEVQRIETQLHAERAATQVLRGTTARAHADALAQLASEAAAKSSADLSQLEASRFDAQSLRADLRQQAQAATEAASAMNAEREHLSTRIISLERKIDDSAAALRALEVLLAAVRAGRAMQAANAAGLAEQLRRQVVRRRRALERAHRYRADLQAQRSEYRGGQEQSAALAHQVRTLEQDLAGLRVAGDQIEREAAELRACARKMDEERTHLAARAYESDELLRDVESARSRTAAKSLRAAINQYFAEARAPNPSPRARWLARLSEGPIMSAYPRSSTPAPKPAHLEALLALPGAEFVDATYQVILGREADPEGRTFFRARLLEGIGKLQILREFAESPEARARGESFPGLAAALAREHNRMAGWRKTLLRWLGVTDHERTAELRMNQLEARADVHHDAVRGQAEALTRQLQTLEQRQAAISGRADATAERVESVCAQIARLDSELESLRLRSAGQDGHRDRRQGSRSPLDALAIAERARVRP